MSFSDELESRKAQADGTRPLPIPGQTYVPWEMMKPGWTSEHPKRADNWDVERDAMLWLLTESIEEAIATYERWIRGDDRPTQPTWWDRIKAGFRAWHYGRCYHGINTFLEACPICVRQNQQCVEFLRELKPRALAFYRSRDFWLQLGSFEFKHQAAKLFQQLGKQADVTRSADDSGADIFLRDESGLTAVQCKAHREPIGPAVVRDLYGAMAHFRANRGMIVSAGGYTAGAREFARDKPIDLLDLGDLLKLQLQVLDAS